MGKWWDELMNTIDWDERIVLPHHYRKNRDLYDKLRGIAWLVRHRDDPTGELDWLWAHASDRLGKDLEMVMQIYIVRIRLPWDGPEAEFVIDEKEYEENGDWYEIIEVYPVVRDKKTGKVLNRVNKQRFERDRERYEVLSNNYLVSWIPEDEDEPRNIEIPEDHIHMIMNE